MPATTIHLKPSFFGEREHLLVQHGPLAAYAFRYNSGVAALRLQNDQGELIMLPFQGQQIWSAEFGGRNLTMRSMFDEPQDTREYLQTYGGFLIHCGATAMGVPVAAAGDTHPLHGELPNAPYQHAWLVAGEDQDGPYLALAGQYRHTVAFSYNYVAEPEVRLYAGATTFPITITIHNLKATPMELMYLAHVNFRPVDNSRLIYSAACTPEHVRVRTSIPSHVHPLPGYAEFLAELAQHPERHNILAPGLAFDPEVVFFIDYLADADGWAHSLQVHPDGTADIISHKTAQLDHGVRWICRTPDQDAIGMCLPGTAEPEGYHAEKAKGNVRTLDAGAAVRFEMRAGCLPAAGAAEWTGRIESLIR
ncbi:MAG TPA: DUF4432 family protein [Anaerolineae bacterium]